MADNHFLVAIDTTDEAEDVLGAARNLANRLDADLTVLSVVRPLPLAYSEFGLAPLGGGGGASSLDIQGEALRAVRRDVLRMAEKFDIAADRCEVVMGTPAAEIRRMADERDVDLIVIGTHGRHGLGLMLGSTANGVLHGVPCDVFAVRIKQDD